MIFFFYTHTVQCLLGDVSRDEMETATFQSTVQRHNQDKEKKKAVLCLSVMVPSKVLQFGHAHYGFAGNLIEHKLNPIGAAQRANHGPRSPSTPIMPSHC